MEVRKAVRQCGNGVAVVDVLLICQSCGRVRQHSASCGQIAGSFPRHAELLLYCKDTTKVTLCCGADFCVDALHAGLGTCLEGNIPQV